MNGNDRKEMSATQDDQEQMQRKLQEYAGEIAQLRKSVETQPHIPKTIKDETLLMFLHSCYYNVKSAEKTLTTYFQMRSNVTEFFTGRDFKSNQMTRIQEVVKFCFLPNRTEKGWAVLMAKLVNYEASQLHLESAIKLLFMHVDAFLLSNPLVPGVVFIYDSQGISLGHLARINLSIVRKYLTYVQEAMPLRLKELKVINVNNIIPHIMTLIKPFIHKQHLQHIKFHTPGDVTEMYEKIPREMWPKDYNGEQTSFETLNKLAINQLTDCFGAFGEEEQLLSELNKDRKKSKSGGSSIQGSFKKLDLD